MVGHQHEKSQLFELLVKVTWDNKRKEIDTHRTTYSYRCLLTEIKKHQTKMLFM